MKQFDLAKFCNDAKKAVIKKSPEILTGIGIAGFFTAGILAVKVTPIAMALIEEKKKEESKDELEPVEVIKATWKCYIPAVATSVTSTACIIGAHRISTKRTAALATAYSLTESAFKAYQDKVIETIGEKKEKKIRDDIAADEIKKNPVVSREVIFTGKGETLCYETVGGRYFKHDIEKIRKAEAQLNKELYSSMFVSLNDFYYEMGLSGTDLGDELGWNVDDGPIEFCYSSQLADDDTPCLVISFQVAPRYDYSKLL